MTRIMQHPILGEIGKRKKVKIMVDGKEMYAYEGEMIAAALWANGIHIFRYTKKLDKPRGVFCGIGKCTDCIMIVNGQPNVRTCITPVEEGMIIETQYGLGKWKEGKDYE
ncbi:(2Fe-2S)-binding protein [Crassaminicella thermophila]|uniref:(2Fe-2S)-binding protein n=1 Tax=Crassaminicella thermophila TaxID=2599308 RepID=A0A5C0SES6_CRATE|nr:(2Fe-2S)-binding protein [Crassaminicella thermophila]QEK12442.1 (2Fe-2S)-binding protein [Crassaminicella thermophila]